MNQNIKTAVSIVGTVAVVGLTAKSYLDVRRTEHAKRIEIKKNMNLDLEAIRRASNVTHERLNSGGYSRSTVIDVIDDLQNEIDFQKIAIREEF